MELIASQHPEAEEDIDFGLANGRTKEENKQRWRVLKKFVEGRLKKSFKEVLTAVSASIGDHPRIQGKQSRLLFEK